MTMANNGRAKLTEECGELLQVLGKIDAYGLGDHPDGGGLLAKRMEDEMADVEAAIAFVIETHNLDWAKIQKRSALKLATFQKWHEDPNN